MSSCWGDNLKISLFGESHGAAIGVSIDGLPAGFALDFSEIERQLARRKTGGELVTKRAESDEFEVLSGVFDGKTTGAPLAAITRNRDAKSESYDNLKFVPRPAHADFTAAIKYDGANDVRGGGHFSARLTAPLVFAGAIARQILRKKGIEIAAHLYSVRDVYDDPLDPAAPDLRLCAEASLKAIAAINKNAERTMREVVEKARADGDSIGGIVECAVTGVPVGLGDPIFGGAENKISSIIFGIPAVKGVEFGAGFGASKLFGSENNDAFAAENGRITTLSNNAGGILGGITSGMPIIFRAALKPTPSIAKTQQSVDLETLENKKLNVKGRHDPCVALRAVPCVEAAAAIAILDMYLTEYGRKL